MKCEYIVVPRLLPPDSDRRLGQMLTTYITIHETSLGTELRDTKGGTMYGVKHYESVLRKPDPENHIAYHFLVEANYGEIPKVYQFLEPLVITHHAGSPEGNRKSIGIERLVNTDTNMDLAISVQACFTSTLMASFFIPISHVVPHKFWSGKECPARLLAGLYGGWDGFIYKVRYYFGEK